MSSLLLCIMAEPISGGAVLTDTDLRSILCVSEQCPNDALLQIVPYSEASLTPVGYDLRVGYRYTSTKSEATVEVKDGDEIVIRSGDTCLIRTMEAVAMPRSRSLSGLIVSTVTMVARGLSHVSTSIDADWSGPLMIVVHNHAPGSVTLKVGEPLCTAIFLANRTPSTKTCGVYAGRDDVFGQRLIEATLKSRRRRESYLLAFILLIPIALLVGHAFFDNDSGMIATTAAGIAVAGMLYNHFREKWRR